MFKNLLFFITLMLSAACSGCKKDAEVKEVEVTDTSPITWNECGYEMNDHPCDFTLSDQNAAGWNLYENYGSIIILDFSTEWCYYCQVAASEAQTLQDAYADKDVIYVTVLIDDIYGQTPSQETIESWADTFGITAPVLRGNRNMLRSDEEDGWPVSGWPTFYFIDRELKISDVMRGYSDSAMISTLDSMLVEDTQ
jgi:thiol-disulfide isomerase/thioredoxin